MRCAACLLALLVAPERATSAQLAYLAPVKGTWQVWLVADDQRPRALTNGGGDKIALSYAPGSDELLALTREGFVLSIEKTSGRAEPADCPRRVREFSLSRSGRFLAYTADVESSPGLMRTLFVYDRVEQKEKQIKALPGIVHTPVWMMDERRLAVSVKGPEGNSLWIVDTTSSSRIQLTLPQQSLFEPAVGPDDTIYASMDRGGGNFDVVSVNPATYLLATVVEGPGFDGDVSVGLGGREIAFVSRGSGHASLWTADARGKNRRQIATESTDVRSPRWIAEKRLAGETVGRLAFLRMAGGRWESWSAKPDGSDLRPLVAVPCEASRLTVSRDGGKVLINCSDGRVYLATPGQSKRELLSLDPSDPTDAAISPDGSQIVYSANSQGGRDANDIWTYDLSLRKAKRVVEQPFLQHDPAWGPGGAIYYLSGHGRESHDIWRAGKGGEPPTPVIDKHHYNFEPSVSETGDLFFSSDESGSYEIWSLPNGAVGATMLTEGPGSKSEPVVSRDGQELAFVSRNAAESRLHVLDLKTNEDRAIAISGDVRSPCWYEPPNE